MKVTCESECVNCHRLVTAEGTIAVDGSELFLDRFFHLDGSAYCYPTEEGTDEMAEPRIEGTPSETRDGRILLCSPTVLYGAKVRNAWADIQSSFDA